VGSSFFLTLHISTLWLSCPQFVQCLPILPSSICVFVVVVDLKIYGTNSAFWASTGVIPSSHKKTTSLCNYNTVCFIHVVAIFKQYYNHAQNIVVKKLSMVGVCNPWASFYMCSLSFFLFDILELHVNLFIMHESTLGWTKNDNCKVHFGRFFSVFFNAKN
jgi:hypothetical protein